MNPRKVIIRNETLRARAIEMIQEHRIDPEKPVSVTLAPYKCKRSRDQNDYYWKLVSDIANFMGEEGKTGREYVSMMMKQEFLNPITKTELPSGDIYVTFSSTADMTVKELAEFCEMVERWAVQTLGFVRNDV